MVPAILFIGLIAILVAANAKSKKGRTLTPPDDSSEPQTSDRDGGAPVTRTPVWAAPRTLANHDAPTARLPRSQSPRAIKLEILIGLQVSSFEKVFMSTDDLETKLVAFTTSSTRRLNRLGYAGRFAHPRVSYADKDYGFQIAVDLDYGATLSPAEMTLFQQHVSGFIAENDQLRPRLLFVHARKV